MSRTVSWIPRLPDLLRSVSSSVRSHYSTPEIERLFEIQPRSAQMLMGLLPTVSIGTCRLVERQALAAFLQQLNDSSDPARELAAIRTQGRPLVVRRKLRELVQSDLQVDASSLPSNIHLKPGEATIRFSAVEDLVTALLWFAQRLDQDLDEFASRYEPPLPEAPFSSDFSDDATEHSDVDYIREFLAKHA
jgi:hypothetical protein